MRSLEEDYLSCRTFYIYFLTSTKSFLFILYMLWMDRTFELLKNWFYIMFFKFFFFVIESSNLCKISIKLSLQDDMSHKLSWVTPKIKLNSFLVKLKYIFRNILLRLVMVYSRNLDLTNISIFFRHNVYFRIDA